MLRVSFANKYTFIYSVIHLFTVYDLLGRNCIEMEYAVLYDLNNMSYF